MPHCELDLYELFWRANWSDNALRWILLVGNDLKEYATKYILVLYKYRWKSPHEALISRPTHELASNQPCIYRIGIVIILYHMSLLINDFFS
jgi:hypothetical protein